VRSYEGAPTLNERFRFWFERQPPDEYRQLLEESAEILGNETVGTDRLETIGQAQAIIASARIRYDGALMDRAPGLQVISRTGIGVDNIAIDEATSRGIAVCNVPNGPTVSTSEHTVALMLAVCKQLSRAARALLEGHGDFFNEYQGVELDGLCCGLVGLGQIGRRVAVVTRALGMHVIAYDPYVDPEIATTLQIELVPDLDTLLKQADTVSLHTPLTPDTNQMINAQRLALMKPGAILINTARGGLIDETALLQALDSGHLRGAGLDVFEPEPPNPTNQLLHRDNVIATPHIAGATIAGKDRLWRAAIAQALQVLNGERPAHLVNLPESGA
jgi:D-3-phosphoglycerate dehydrogenase / 2-oxoglutarate reductase